VNKEEGQSMGRTTGASGEQAEQQRKTIEGQDAQPGKIWQESDKSQYTGHGDTNVGSDPRGGESGAKGGDRGATGQGMGAGTGGESSGANPQGSYAGHGNTNVGGSDPDVRHDTKDEQPENEQIDETQWQGNRFGQGGTGGSNG
jgi:hypothetical protein